MRGMNTCPCCGYKTMMRPVGGTHGTYDICPVCFWEDDGIQLADPDYEGGANRPSLRQAQQNFIAFGACEERLIECVKPRVNYDRDADWKPF